MAPPVLPPPLPPNDVYPIAFAVEVAPKQEEQTTASSGGVLPPEESSLEFSQAQPQPSGFGVEAVVDSPVPVKEEKDKPDIRGGAIAPETVKPALSSAAREPEPHEPQLQGSEQRIQPEWSEVSPPVESPIIAPAPEKPVLTVMAECGTGVKFCQPAAVPQVIQSAAPPTGRGAVRSKFKQLSQAFQAVPIPIDGTQSDAAPSLETRTVEVQKIQVVGSTILTLQEIEPLVQPLQNRTVTLEDLEDLADKVTQLYLQRGFLTSRAILDQGGIANGVVPIRVIEDTLEDIQIEGLQRLKPDYLRSRIRRAAGTPINVGQLEEQLRLLRADPLFENVEATLRVGSGVGKTVLVVRATEAKSFSGNVFSNNYSPPSVGGEQFGTTLSYRNLTGNGDLLFGGYRRSTTGGSETIDLGYQIPVSPSEATLQLRASWSNNKITQAPFDVLGIRADSELYEVNFRQPLIRSSREELALSLGFAYQNGQTFIFNDTPFFFGVGPDAAGVSRTSVIKFGQEYVRRDPAGAWAFRSLFSLGTGLFGATKNPGAAIPDGQFFAWLGQAQRVQRLGNDHLLIVQADVQLTPDSLLPSQQFVIGGGQSVRGYRQNARSGDNGFRFSVEDRIALQRDANGSPILQLAPFVEMGTVWNKSSNPNLLPDRNFLASIGLGLLWQPVPKLNIRVDYGLPLVRLSDRGNNMQDSGVYFSVNYQF